MLMYSRQTNSVPTFAKSHFKLTLLGNGRGKKTSTSSVIFLSLKNRSLEKHISMKCKHNVHWTFLSGECQPFTSFTLSEIGHLKKILFLHAWHFEDGLSWGRCLRGGDERICPRKAFMYKYHHANQWLFNALSCFWLFSDCKSCTLFR